MIWFRIAGANASGQLFMQACATSLTRRKLNKEIRLRAEILRGRDMGKGLCGNGNTAGSRAFPKKICGLRLPSVFRGLQSPPRPAFGCRLDQAAGLTSRVRRERFRAKWVPVRVKKTRQTEVRSPGFDPIKAGQARVEWMDLTFATQPSHESECGCQIQNSTRNLYLLVVFWF
jgi:hypothetical protein